MLQDAGHRPDFPTIQQRLARFASETFQCSADDALRAKHLKERALLDQILPPKVHPHALLHHTLTMFCHLQILDLCTSKHCTCLTQVHHDCHMIVTKGSCML